MKTINKTYQVIFYDESGTSHPQSPILINLSEAIEIFKSIKPNENETVEILKWENGEETEFNHSEINTIDLFGYKYIVDTFQVCK